MSDLAIKHVEPKGVRLKHVAMTGHGDKRSLVMTLAGDEMSLAAAQGALNAQEQKNRLGFVYVERPENTSTLKVTVAAEPAGLDMPAEEKPAAVVEAIHDITGCRLGRIQMQAEALAAPGKGKQYSMGVMISPIADPRDRGNLAGHYSMEVIRRKQEKRPLNGCIVDPHNLARDTLRLLKVDKLYDSSQEALHHAEEMIGTIKNSYGIYTPKPVALRLLGVSNLDALGESELEDGGGWMNRPGVKVTKATLAGNEKALKQAYSDMEGAFSRQVYMQRFRNGNLELILQGDGDVDASRLVGKAHDKTRCTLPVDIIAGAERDEADMRFRPMLSVRSKDVPVRERAATQRALAGLVALKLPDREHVVYPDRPDYGVPPRVVVNDAYSSEGDALEDAQGMRDKVVASLNERLGKQR